MRIEVINTGTELLLGNVVNSHLAFFGQELFTLGLRIQRQVTVPDGADIGTALTETFGRADTVLVTGGLGPTTDDITREVAADLFGLELVFDPAIYEAIEQRFAKRGIQITDRIKRQAFVPSGATVLPNRRGTAPGLYLPAKETRPHLFLLPGPPRELRPMFADQVLPTLRELLPEPSRVTARNFRIIGMGESQVEALIGDQLLAIPGIELGYCARPGEVDVRLIGTPEVVTQGEAIVAEALKDRIATRENRSLAEVVLELLRDRKQSLAVAESCTGGFVANALTDVPGASEVFVQGFVTYSNAAKTSALAVSPDLLAKHGAVSAEVATAMAEGARTASGADFALATTGIAGPGGGTPEKPVGTVYIALASASTGGAEAHRHFFPTDRLTFKSIVSQYALELLRRSVG